MEYAFGSVQPSRGVFSGIWDSLKQFGLHISDHVVPHARNNYHPHLFTHRATGLLSGLLISLKIFTVAVVSFGPILPAYSSAISINNIISLTNQSRSDYNLGILTQNQVLDKAAQTKANDMLAKGYFSHNTPDGKTPWDFIVGAGYNYITAGENLAVNFTEAENVETAWMNSPGHKANILNKNFQEIGVGIAQGQYQGHEAIFVVQMFGTPAEQKIVLSEKPTMVQTQSVPSPAPATQKPVMAASAVIKKSVVASAAPAPTEAVKPVSKIPELTISNAQVRVVGQNAVITAQTSEAAVKVLVNFDQAGIMLSPKEKGMWEGSMPLAQLAHANNTVVVNAYDMAGVSAKLQLADFATATPENYHLTGSVKGANIQLFGRVFNPNQAENNFYLFFIASLLTSLVIAFAARRHIQHLSMVANGSFVVALAALLLMS